ncbi:MAG: NnrU family protein [Hyphomicrobiaceae bacterium]
MILLLLGLLIFLGIHLVPTQPTLRQGLAARFGEGAYKGLFAVIAFAGLALIVLGYHKIQLAPGKNPVLWSPPAWGRHVTMTLMLPVFILLIAAYLPGRITAAVRHPMILAVKLWALAHLFVRGDAASLALFAGFLAWAVFDRISLKRREAAGLVVPKSGPVLNDVIAVIGGLVLYYIMMKWGHPALIGVRVIP